MTNREWIIGISMLAVGLAVGSTKGDDFLEWVQGIEKSKVSLGHVAVDNNQAIAEKFSIKIRQRLSSTTPLHLQGKKFKMEMVMMPDGYRFDLTSGGKLVAQLFYDAEGEYKSGGWN